MIFKVIKYIIIITLIIFIIINIIEQFKAKDRNINYQNYLQNINSDKINSQNNLQNINSQNNLQNINSQNNLQNINSQNDLQNINSQNDLQNILNNLIIYHNQSDISCQIKNKNNLNLSFNINNLQENLYFTKNNIKFDIINNDNFERIDNNNFIYIKTKTNPPFYLNTNIDGIISLELNKNKVGNKWLLFKLNNPNIFKKILINNNEIITNNFIEDMKFKLNRLPNNFSKEDLKKKINNKILNNELNDKYKYFYNNGIFIKSKDFDYFITKKNNYIKCNLYPSINDIFFFYN